MVIIMPFIKIGRLNQHLASIGGSCPRVLAASCILHIFHSLLSSPAVSDLTKLNRWWFGPIMFHRAQAKGICWLPLCLVFFFFFLLFSPKNGSGKSNGVLWLYDVRPTVYRRGEAKGGWKAQWVLSHEPVSAGPGLNGWTRASASTKISVMSTSFMREI